MMVSLCAIGQAECIDRLEARATGVFLNVKRIVSVIPAGWVQKGELFRMQIVNDVWKLGVSAY